MIISISTGIGLSTEIRNKISSLNGHIQITTYDNNNSEVSTSPISLNQNFYPNWGNLFGDNISYIQPVITKGAVIRTPTTFEGVIVKGVDENYNWTYIKKYLVDGDILNTKTNDNEILISQYLSNRLNLKVGDRCNTVFLREDGTTPNQRNFIIKGIFNSGLNMFDSTFIISSLSTLAKINRWSDSEVGAFEVFVKDFDKIEQTNNKIYGEILSTLDSRSIAEKYTSIFSWFETFTFNIVIIISIMILIGGVNIITAILVLILERTPMIGTLKAMGATSWSIRKIFIYNAIYLICVGLFWGNFISISLLLIQKHFKLIKLDPSIYYISDVAVNIDVFQILYLNLGVLILCVLMLVIPSIVVSKISPIKAIKFD